MEKSSPPKNTDQVQSCWDFLKLKLLPWAKRPKGSHNTTRQTSVGCNIAAALVRNRIKHPKPGGGFKYDPKSYSNNFDEGGLSDDNDSNSYRGFSSRYAALPSSGSLGVTST